MAEPDEKRLLAMAQRGDTRALGILLEGQRDRLFNVCLRMVSNRDDAAELTQDTLLRTMEKLDQFEGRAKLSTWMTRIAMNLSVSHLRKRKVRRAASLDQPTPPGAGGGGGYGDHAGALRSFLADQKEPSAADRVETDDMLEHLETAMTGLDEEFRAVIVLRDIEQMDYQGMADVLEIPVGTVKSRLFRARLALRESMQSLDAHLDHTPGQARTRKEAGHG